MSFNTLAHASSVSVNLTVTTLQDTGIGISTIVNIEHLSGGAGNDIFTGNSGNNLLRGNAGNDTVFGGDGNDLLDGGGDTDRIVGGNGNDTYTVNNSEDSVVESEADSNIGGFDLVNSMRGSYTLPANVESDAILNTGAANMSGKGLNNTIDAGRGNNSIDGGDGSDTVNYVNATTGGAGVTVSLAITTAQTTGGTGDDILLSIEHPFGSHENDVLTGNALANRLDGSHGNDILSGGTDKIVLSSEIFAAFRASGTLTAANFLSGAAVTTAQDADDLLIHNWTTNFIYYDADGNGTARSPIPFARLADSDYSTVTINDFELISNAGVVVGSTGGDSLVGSSGPDLLDGGEGGDSINGGDGDNILLGGTGNDVVIGGPGIDTASYTSATSNAVAELRRGKASDGQGGKDTLSSIENLQGGPQNDILVGDDGPNFSAAKVVMTSCTTMAAMTPCSVVLATICCVADQAATSSTVAPASTPLTTRLNRKTQMSAWVKASQIWSMAPLIGWSI